MGKLADHIVCKARRQSWTGAELGLCRLKAHPQWLSSSTSKKFHTLPKVHQQLRPMLVVLNRMSPQGTLGIQITIDVSHLWRWHNIVILEVYAREPPCSCCQQSFKNIFNVLSGFMAFLLGCIHGDPQSHAAHRLWVGYTWLKVLKCQTHQHLTPRTVSDWVPLLSHALNSKQKCFGYRWLSSKSFSWL